MSRLTRSRRFIAASIVASALLWIANTPASAQQCTGDCNHDGSVSVNELIMGVNIALERAPARLCPAIDLNDDAVVTVTELTSAVISGIEGCPISVNAKTFRSIQEVFTTSCALPSCHSPLARQGGLVLSEEGVSYDNLVEQASLNPAAGGMMRVKSGDPANSFLIEKLRSTVPGVSMPQNAPPLSEEIIAVIEDWIERGAHETLEECEALGNGTGLVGSGAHGDGAETVCDSGPIDGDFVWKPENALAAPAKGQGIQLYVPPKPIPAGSEWESCFAFEVDWAQVKSDIGLTAAAPTIEWQEYRMHSGSHHLLVYQYFGAHTDWEWPKGHYECSAGNCTRFGECSDGTCSGGKVGESCTEDEDCDECPPDYGRANLVIGGTQVAGTRYQVVYPEGVGLPIFGDKVVIIANLHYTNPFQPAQDIYGEAWLNINFHQPGEFNFLLNGVFAIGFRDLFVEPYTSRNMSMMWRPRGIVTREPANAAIFNLFGHMHKRGTSFTIDLVRDGACSVSGALCGRDDDCACRNWETSCTPGQTCVLGPNHEDTRIYSTASWDNAPVIDFPDPYFRVNVEDGLRWSCTHVNGVEGDPTRPPKKCSDGCRACGWDDETRTCIFDRGIFHGVDSEARIYQEGDPMPLVFDELADDDMCNMFGYFLDADDWDAR